MHNALSVIKMQFSPIPTRLNHWYKSVFRFFYLRSWRGIEINTDINIALEILQNEDVFENMHVRSPLNNKKLEMLQSDWWYMLFGMH